jgi:diguanylate cyclase (GGDEF)-like protein
MLNISILILLTLFLVIYLKKISDRSFLKEKITYEQTSVRYDKLLCDQVKLKADNLNLIQKAEETIALYDITKDICRPLEEEKVFSILKAQINKYIEIEDCKFLKSDADITQYNNYTFLPLMIDRRIAGYLLVSGIDEHDRDKFGILAQEFMLGIKRAILYQRVQEMAITDSLTGVFSRRYLMERFNEEVERSKKFNYNFSFLMVDIDHFKGYNDRYGHLVGDAILKEVARAIKENIRQIDLVGRYGGEEFSVILTETDRGGAEFAAERIRQAIEQKNIRVYDETLQATISIGIAIFPDNATDPGELIEKADQALYQAKQAGRNRVCVYTRTHGR